MANAKISPANIPNVLEKSTSLELTYKKIHIFAESRKQPVFISST